MKKILIIIALLHMYTCVKAQSITKNSEEAETYISMQFCRILFTKFNRKDVLKEYERTFSVKFELNKKGEPINIQLSVNMKDTLIMNITKSILSQSQKIWDIEQCKKYNPTLKFILPIRMNISSKNINLNKLIDKSPEILDFSSLIKFSPIEHDLEYSLRPSKEKFVGMILNPIFVNNSRPFD